MPIYRLDKTKLQVTYERLGELANYCRDDDGPPKVYDSYLSNCDLTAKHLREKLDIEMADTATGAITAIRSDETLNRLYKMLYRLDAEDGRLDGRVQAAQDVLLNIEAEADIRSAAERVKPSVVATALTMAKGNKSFASAFIVGREAFEREGKTMYRYTAFSTAHAVDEAYEDEKKLEVIPERGAAPVIAKARVDNYKDFAVIEFEYEKILPAAPLGDSSLVQEMEATATLGNRRGAEITITTGSIVSTSAIVENFLGTAFKVNDSATHGNSGGPVINARGEVVGIVFKVEAGTAGGHLSMAIPINDAVTSAKMLAESGKATYNEIYYTTKLLPHEARKDFGIEGGIYFSFISPNSLWASAGLMSGDIVLAVDGDTELPKIGRDADLSNFDKYIVGKRPGSVVRLKIFRNGKELGIEVALKGLSFESPRALQTPYGFTAFETTPYLERRFDIPHSGTCRQDIKGVLVNNDGQRKWTESGLPHFSVITHVGTVPVRSIDEFMKEVERQKGNGFLVLKYYATEKSPERTGTVEYAVVPVVE